MSDPRERYLDVLGEMHDALWKLIPKMETDGLGDASECLERASWSIMDAIHKADETIREGD